MTKSISRKPRGQLPRLGRREAHAGTTLVRLARPLRWPKERSDQYELFDVWHLVAMRRVHREKREQPFRTVAVIRQAIHWATGKFDHTNAYLAELAGTCHPKTIERDIQKLVDLQLVEYKLVHVRSKSGKQVLRRIVSLTMPGDIGQDDIEIDVHRHDRRK